MNQDDWGMAQLWNFACTNPWECKFQMLTGLDATKVWVDQNGKGIGKVDERQLAAQLSSNKQADRTLKYA